MLQENRPQKFKNEFASFSEWKSWLAIYLKTSLAHFTVKGEGSLKIWTEKAETRGCSITWVQAQQSPIF